MFLIIKQTPHTKTQNMTRRSKGQVPPPPSHRPIESSSFADNPEPPSALRVGLLRSLTGTTGPAAVFFSSGNPTHASQGPVGPVFIHHHHGGAEILPRHSCLTRDRKQSVWAGAGAAVTFDPLRSPNKHSTGLAPPPDLQFQLLCCFYLPLCSPPSRPRGGHLRPPHEPSDGEYEVVHAPNEGDSGGGRGALKTD